ncbi:MAG: hypothetical protein CSB24_01165 [Deltaproteobacteria bacterium]|nr:MAG: hypothetical protein CSB24_01165 [Deltaproteobacteria bacterium]
MAGAGSIIGDLPETTPGQSPPQAEKFFPALREDINLHPAAPLADGSPTWVLHDPVSNRFVQIGWQEFEILQRWEMRNIKEIVQAVNRDTTLEITPEDVMMVGNFLVGQQFLNPVSPAALKERFKLMEKKRGGGFSWLLHHYLFFRVPLFHPDQFLADTLWLVRPFFTRSFALLVLLGGMAGALLVIRQWEVFIQTSLNLLSFESLIFYILAVIFAKCVHELGHAYSCKRHGLNVPVFGVAFLVLCPFLYTDTGESWKLTSRRKRLEIVAAGMMAEGTLAVFAALAWSILPPGPLRNTAFFLATTSLFMTLIINISPFMRWDGYYLLSDLTGIKNLQPRSMELAKWRLREFIFGFGSPPPEENPPLTRRFMIIYAYLVWLYRFTVFIGIAMLVYHFFIKAVGIFLMAVELLWFIWLPIQRELLVWYQKRGEMHWNKNSIISITAAGLMLLLFILPWKNYLLLPAVIKPDEFMELYSQVPGKVEHIYIEEGEGVQKGQILFAVRSPELDYQLKRAVLEVQQAGNLLKRSAVNDQLREQQTVAEERYIEALQRVSGLQKQKKMLDIKAPFSGKMVSLPDTLKENIWIAETDRLGILAQSNRWLIYAYARAGDLERLRSGTAGLFYAGPESGKPLPARIVSISQVNIKNFTEPMLTSINGGPIAVSLEQDGKYLPEESVFQVQLELTGEKPYTARMIQPGVVRIKARPVSLAAKVFRNLHSLFIRESGF